MLISCFVPRRGGIRRAMLFACCVLAALSHPALAAGAVGDSVFLEDMTWRELSERIGAGSTVMLVPIGGTEQNGPDMALGKHNLRAKLLAEKIARQLGNALVAPVLAYVPEGDPMRDSGHLHFAGTLSISSTAFIGILEGTAESLYLHGVKTVVFLGDHGGYQNEMHRAATELNLRFKKTGEQAVALDAYYQASSSGFDALLKRAGYSDAEIGTHAGLADTSLTLALAPQLVRADRLPEDGHGGVAVGLHGDPSRASAALGQKGVDLIVTDSVKAIRTLRASAP